MLLLLEQVSGNILSGRLSAVGNYYGNLMW